MLGDQAHRGQVRGEVGSILLLMPVAVLVVVILSSIAVDQAVVFGAQRELVADAQSAANDGASIGVDLDRLHGDGVLAYDTRRIGQAVDAALVGPNGGSAHSWSVHDGVVEVRVERVVHLVFAGAVPGARRDVRITATATANLVTSQ